MCLEIPSMRILKIFIFHFSKLEKWTLKSNPKFWFVTKARDEQSLSKPSIISLGLVFFIIKCKNQIENSYIFKLTPDDWERVVAVFVHGPAWQFKNWPIMERNDVNSIFKKVCVSPIKSHLYLCQNTQLPVWHWNDS